MRALGSMALLVGAAALGCSTEAAPTGTATTPGAGGSAASTGGTGGGGGVPEPVGPTPEVTGPRESECAVDESNKPGYRMLRRLSQAEYNRTLANVFGVAETAWQTIEFPGELRMRGVYDSYADALSVNEGIQNALVEKTFERAATLLGGSSALLVPPCNAASIDAGCADAMVRHYGYRLFRRPLTTVEVSDYVGLFTRGVTELALSAADALSGTVAALMQAPYTLYIEQLGSPDSATAGAQYRLGPYEVASVLAYGLTGSAPTAALLDRVGTGELTTPASVTAVAQELRQSAAGQQHIGRFFGAWLNWDHVKFTTKDPAVYQLSPELAQAMADEQRLLVTSTYQAGGSLTDLLLAPKTYLNLTLAQHYGFPTAGLGTALVEQPRPAGRGLGVLAQGAFLTRAATSNSSSPTQRGVYVLGTLACLELGQPPPVVPEIIPPTGEITTRERYEKVHGVAGCSACHARFDPIGFGLEAFDGMGRFREQEVGKPIDATGSMKDLGGQTFNGAEELAQALAGAPLLQQCFAAQLSSFVYGVSIRDGLCLAPPTSYAPGTALTTAIDAVATAAHLSLRAP